MDFNNLKDEAGNAWNQSLASPPKQYTITLAANGGQEKVFYNANYMRVLTLLDPTGVTVRFGDSGTATDIVGAGLGYELPFVVGNITFRNDSATPKTITFAVAIGRIFDDRLNVSGNITVVNTLANALYTRPANTTIADNTSVTLVAGVSSAVLNLNIASQMGWGVQNVGTQDCYFGWDGLTYAQQVAQGIKLVPGAILLGDGRVQARCSSPVGTEIRTWQWR